MTELLSCPFCGKAAYAAKDTPRGWFVECLDGECGGSTRDHDEGHQAIAAWNRRAGHGREAALREALQGAEAFIGVMFGDGPNAVIPETVRAPLGVDVKVGNVMRNIARALAGAPPEPTEKDKS